MFLIKGVIIKGIGGFYYVQTEEELVESRAKGAFRDEGITPLVGDKVEVRIDPDGSLGYIEKIYPRESELLRPPVANVTQGIVFMSVKDPDINTWLLDKFLLMAEYEGLDVLICLSKSDLDEEKAERLKSIYEKIGYKVLKTSIYDEESVEKVKTFLGNHISVFAGPSGAGKSSMINKINPELNLEVGLVSDKTKRGKHTTRHTELMKLEENSYILDSPGFSSLRLEFIEDESELRYYFREIAKVGENCKFQSCLHINEPNCEVKRQVESGEIDRNRYENYLSILDEIKKTRRY